MKLSSVIGNTALAVICLLLLIPTLVHGVPFLVGADSSYTVLSGSMSPTLKPGDLVLVKQIDPATVEVDDIVTVKYETGVFTHRVFEKRVNNGVVMFRTKGDANEDPDPSWWNASQIVGKTVFGIPLGHLYSPYGYTLSFLVPCVLLVGKQMYHVFSLFKRRSKRELRRWRRRNHSVLDTTSVLLLMILVVSGSWLIGPYFQLGSFSYFSDSEWASVSFTAGEWVIKAEIDIDPDTLNLGSEGNPVIAYITTEYDEKDIIVDTVMLDGTVTVYHSDIQGDSLMVQFNRTIVEEYLIGKGCGAGNVTLTVSGEFTDGIRFTGEDTIKLI